ncbi:MAG: VCBS repeat-containing protein [Pyrinomonadaceae bacterium]
MSRRFLSLLALGLLALGTVFISFSSNIAQTARRIQSAFFETEPDIPEMLKHEKATVSKQDFLTMRAEYFGELRGIAKDNVPAPGLRQEALEKMDGQLAAIERMPEGNRKNLLGASWTAIGPNPIISGTARYSGRTISIAVHPTDPNIVFVGTAQGGLYLTTDGGFNWTSLMDTAQSLAIGAIAISPSNPGTIYIGTGEHNFSSDSFFGVGVYRITISSVDIGIFGPLNRDAQNNDVFSGRGISRIVVHPTDPATIFVATTSGVGGISGSNSVFPSRGVYRSTNATSATPTFAKLTGLAGNLNASVRDIAIDPSNPDILIANVIAGSPSGGIYRSTNALANNPNFSLVQLFDSGSTSELTAEFAAIHPSGDTNATFYAATGNLGGRVLRSTDGGESWTERIDNNFCTPQCFYDIAIAVDPTNASRIYLGGAPSVVASFSTDGGATFTSGGSGVHVDTHAFAVAPSDPTIVYLGTDGGIYKSTNSGSSYTHLNNSRFYATQFMSIAVHPTDPDFTIGGTQDNGTNFYPPGGGSWTRVDGGDGGYTVIDQNATDTTNVTMYHTYFNRINSVVGYATRSTTSSAWSFRGCSGVTPANGINCDDTAILFYAPLESGPGNPNTIYYGSDRLYRSADTGINHTVVSQAPISSGVAISAIGIGPNDDNIRLVGLRDGGLFGTINGSSTLVDMDPGNNVPAGFIARVAVDPSNSSIAYATISAFGVNNVFKTTNLNDLGTAPVVWSAANGSGGTAIPQVPVSGFVIDPLIPTTLYAGTDIGVYISTDSGATWNPFGASLPRAAVFDMAIANGSPRKLRIATHGRGMFEIPIESPVASGHVKYDFDGDHKADVAIFRPGPGEWWLLRSSDGGNNAYQFGSSTDTVVTGDYTGDGKYDFAFWRPSTGEWYVLRSEDSTFFAFPFGTTGDIPAPGDFDGDGKTDAAVYRPSAGVWFILRSSNGQVDVVPFGSAGDKPLVGDYDNDGKDDVAIHRPADNQFWINRSTAGVLVYQFGAAGDKPFAADFTGDGTADAGFWRPSTGEWFVIRSENQTFFAFPFGSNGDIPAPADYDGDGTTDATVFRPSTNTWFSNQTTNGVVITPFGSTGDIPVAGLQ